ncbi:phage tail assembly protein [Anaerosporobacter sp.]|uniref:phage tail assembly protein n=1 Tax=Anaerosporobacter sp. TaxID=1872529 RepID=UPI00286EDCD6|nr:phage tail assembly protein [Anaerosporobacter sp.]
MFRTEYEFELPRGYVDSKGNLHKKGIMRLATAADEILPLSDPRVLQNPSYLTVIILTRVIVKLGSLLSIDTSMIEHLYTADLNYLQDFYQRINQEDIPAYSMTCPHCGEKIEIPIDFFSREQ